MRQTPFLLLSPGNLKILVQILFVLGMLVLYALVFPPIYKSAGPVVGAFSVAPVVVMAFWWGMRAGVLGGLISILFVSTLFTLNAPASVYSVAQGVIGGFVLTALGAGVGWARGLLDRVRQQTRELERERQLLQQRTMELEQTNAALVASEEKFRSITQATHDGILISDPDGTILFFNRAAEKIFGYAANEIIGQSVEWLMPPRAFDYFLDGWRHARQDSSAADLPLFQVEGLRKDGTTLPMEISISQTVIDGASVFIGVLRDITRRKHAEMLSAAFATLGQRLNNATNLTDAAEIIVQVADQLLGWDACYVSFYDRAKNYLIDLLKMDVIQNTRVHLPVENQLKLPTGMASRILQGEGQLFNADRNPDVIARMDRFGDCDRPSASLMFVPIRNGSQAIGVLSIQSYTPNAYSPDSLATLQALADHCGGAFERIRSEELIRASLSEKEVLLKEIHHRVKNNLQVISSLLSLQVRNVSEPSSLDVLRDSQHRIRSMALIHEKLYQSFNLARVDFVDYVRNLCAFLWRSYAVNPALISLEVCGADAELGIDQAVPCGLILNELVSNALKHAFPDGRTGRIVVHFARDSSHRSELRVSDDGIGLPADWATAQTSSLGLQLVNTLVNQLEGDMNIERNHGTTFQIRFPKNIVQSGGQNG